MKKKLAILSVLSTAVLAVTMVFAAKPELGTIGNAAWYRNNNGLVNCNDGYQTNFDWNISYDEILGLTSFEEGYKTLDDHEADLVACSSIIEEATAVKGQYYRQEDGKLEVKSLKFGTGSAAGSLSLVLNKQIDAIGFYAEAYQHTKDADGTKTLTVNGIETSGLGNTYSYNSCQRFFVEFSDSTSEVVIAATAASNNRFHLYSIGFYSRNSFPDATLSTKYTISFDANGGTGTMNPIQVKEGISYSLPDCKFTKDGYDFDYWSIGENKQTGSITVNSDITLKANWKEKVTPVGSTITFLPSDFSGQGTSSSGSDMSVTKDGITISTNKGFGTTEIRVYAHGNFIISSSTHTITALSFTFSGGKTGGLSTSYTGLSTQSWKQSDLASQARFSQIIVTYQ